MNRLISLCCVILLSSGWARADHLVFSDVLPILQENCLVCHRNPGAPKQLSMETYKELLQGSENGPVVVVGDSVNSELVKRIEGRSYPRMPMNGPPYLNELGIELIKNWIDAGLKEKE